MVSIITGKRSCRTLKRRENTQRQISKSCLNLTVNATMAYFRLVENIENNANAESFLLSGFVIESILNKKIINNIIRIKVR